MDLDTPAMSDKAKGKQREITNDTEENINRAMDIDLDSDDEQDAPVLPAKSTTIHRHTMFADDDYQRLLVENAHLRKQADLLAKRTGISKPGETSQITTDNVKTSQAEIQRLRTRLAHSESAKERLQRELASLRSFLLSTIAVQPTLLPARPIQTVTKPIETVSPVDEPRREREKTPILLDDGTLQDQASSASRAPINDDLATTTQRAISSDDQSTSQSPGVPLVALSSANTAQAGPSAPVQSIALPPLPKPERPRSRKRVTMGDAETELLLCASKRIQRVYKHIPNLRAAPAAPAASVASASDVGYHLPYPLPWQPKRRPKSPPAELRRPSVTHPRRPSAAPAPVEIAPPAKRRTSKRRSARSYKEAVEDQEDDDDDYSEDAFSPAVEEKVDGGGGTPDESSGRPAKKKKKIGRPLGSPNKTKTISFNKIGNLMNQSPGLLFAGQHLQLASQQQSVGNMTTANGSGGHEDGLQPEGSMEDLLAAAETMRDDASMGGEARALRSRAVTQDPATAVDAEIDDEWPTTIQDEIDGSGDDEYEDGVDSGEYQDDPSTSSRPSINRDGRNSRRSVSQSARPSSSSVTSKSKSTSVPKGGAAPQTPNGIERQISALDVLADQAASASTGPGGQNKAQKGGGTNAAKNMQQALFSGSGSGGGLNSASNAGAPAVASTATQTQNGNATSLGDAFTYQPANIPAPTTFYSPNFDANDNNAVSSSTSISYPSTSTSQYQPFVFPPLPQSTLQDHHSPNLGGNNAALPQYDASAYNATSGTPSTGYASPYPPNHLQQFPSMPDYSPSYETFTAPLPPPTPSQPTSQMTIAQQLSLPISQYHPLIDPEDLNKGMTPAAALAKKSRSPYIKWTVKEDEMLVKGIVKHGTKWDYVAKELPDRSYHQCRQRWLRGLKCGESLPKSIEHLRPQLEAAVAAYENSRNSKKEAMDE